MVEFVDFKLFPLKVAQRPIIIVNGINAVCLTVNNVEPCYFFMTSDRVPDLGSLHLVGAIDSRINIQLSKNFKRTFLLVVNSRILCSFLQIFSSYFWVLYAPHVNVRVIVLKTPLLRL